MKKIYTVIVLALIGGPVMAATYDVECLNHKGKFSGCMVTIDSSNVQVSFKKKGDRILNVTIPGSNIQSLSGGEYIRRRVAEAVFITPWLLFSKKKRDQIGIEYLDDNSKPKVLVMSSHKKYGMPLKTELKAVSGKEVQEDEKPRK